MTIRTALEQGTRLLDEARVPAPRLTAEVLLMHALRQDRTYLYTYPERELDELPWLHYGRYLNERLSGKPTQYITRKQEFFGREFRVTPAVLIPRPETEHLVETALPYITSDSRVIDVGTGSGAIAATLSLERGVPVFATDLSREALAVAAHNIRSLEARVYLAAADLLTGIRDRSLDLVVSNPPYVSELDKPTLQREVRDFEPELALYAGATGHEIYRRLIDESARVLRPGGRIVFELGYRSLEAVQSMLAPAWTGIAVTTDLAGYPRVIAASLP
jgi:release factor glutamine methyltransferase